MQHIPPRRQDFTGNIAIVRYLCKGLAIGTGVGVASGVASAVFLRALDGATGLREANAWLLFLLPLAGMFIGWMYHRYGESVAAGTNLILERAQTGGTEPIPFRMVPLVLGGTLLTHLFGGSSGREGTAVQMSGTLASLVSKPLRLSAYDYHLLLLSGISGGFGSVFGTPLAGMAFGLEVVTVGRVNYPAIVPCFIASLVGDLVCRALGIRHADYGAGSIIPEMTAYRWLLIVGASLLFAGAAVCFIELTGKIAGWVKARVANPVFRPFFGGLALIGLTSLTGTHDYLGLSLPLIAQSFSPNGVAPWAFALKILFTSVTLGTGFKGGEVTPLFCIGATLGAGFAQLTGQPPAFFAALGFAAVFAGAAKTPITCVFLGIELFGAKMGVPLAASCLIAYVLSGRQGIYTAQRDGWARTDGDPVVDSPNNTCIQIPIPEEHGRGEGVEK